MKLSVFLIVSAIGSFAFGGMMFFAPSSAAQLLGLDFTQQSGSLLQGMGGLIIGLGTINLFARNFTNYNMLSAALLSNIITNILGLSVDLIGIFNGILFTNKMAPVEFTHIFICLGSLIYLLRLKRTKPA